MELVFHFITTPPTHLSGWIETPSIHKRNDVPNIDMVPAKKIQLILGNLILNYKISVGDGEATFD
jgi:hypothetical protein